MKLFGLTFILLIIASVAGPETTTLSFPICRALASIAACSRVSLITKQADAQTGTKVVYNDGTLQSIEDCSGTFLDSKNCIRGHEFHYYDSSNNGNSAKAKKPINGRNWDCCHISENHWWGFAHLYYESCPEFVEHFVEYCNKYMVLY